MRKAVYVLAILTGIVAMVSGPLLGVAVAVLARLNAGRGMALPEGTIGLAVALVGLACGGSLVWVGAQALREAPSRLLRLPGWGWWLVAGLIVLAAGQAASGARSAGALLLPLMHVMAAAIGAMLFLSLTLGAARSQGGEVAARPAIGSLDWGALGGVTIGMFLELILVLVVIVGVVVGLGILRPDLAQQLQNLAMQMMQNPGGPPDVTSLRPFVTSPLVVLGVLALLGFAVPLVEEGAKSLAVPIVMLTMPGKDAGEPARPMTRLEGFMFGVAAGAGFTLVEGMLNGSLALATPGSWGAMMAVRGGTAALHCLATGLAGLGWQAGLAERRWGRAAALWLLAVLLHGTWNVAAGVSGLIGLTSQPAGTAGLLGSAGQVASLAFMGFLWVAVVVALPLIARHLAAEQAGAARGAAPITTSTE